MARILLFHHILGITPGVANLKRRLEALNFEVELPDLFDGKIFESVESGLAYVASHQEDVFGCLENIVDSGGYFDAVVGISFGAMVASQLCNIATDHVGQLVFVSAFVAPEDSSGSMSSPKVTVIASENDPFYAGEDHSALLEYRETHPESTLFLFVGRSHFFMDDSHAEYSQAMTDIMLAKIVELISEGKSVGHYNDLLKWHGDSGTINVIETNVSDPRLVYCTQRYRQELFLQIGIDPVTDDEWQYFCEYSRSRLFLAIGGDRSLGTVTLTALDETSFEIKRLWVDQKARGHGIGRRLMDRLEGAALEMGCKRLFLDTHNDLIAAIGLYRSMGYVDDVPYNSNERCQLWMSKSLS
jgi:GNAT superfamily N-acetyltransferase/dienelactone hydrolase